MRGSAERTWPDGIVDRLRVAGQRLLDTAQLEKSRKSRKRVLKKLHRAREELRGLQEFDHLMSRISSRFINLPPSAVDADVERALGQIGECLDVDLGTVLQWLDPAKTTLKVTHEWDSRAVGGPHFRGAVLSSSYPWLAARLTQSRPLVICKLDDFPPEATDERAGCEQVGIESVLFVPFQVEGALEGQVAFNTIGRGREWSEEVIEQIGSLGQVFANAIVRQQHEVELVRASRENRELREPPPSRRPAPRWRRH